MKPQAKPRRVLRRKRRPKAPDTQQYWTRDVVTEGLGDSFVDETMEGYGPATKPITNKPLWWGPADPNHPSPMSDVTWRPEQWEQRYLRRYYQMKAKQMLEVQHSTRRLAGKRKSTFVLRDDAASALAKAGLVAELAQLERVLKIRRGRDLYGTLDFQTAYGVAQALERYLESGQWGTRELPRGQSGILMGLLEQLTNEWHAARSRHAALPGGGDPGAARSRRGPTDPYSMRGLGEVLPKFKSDRMDLEDLYYFDGLGLIGRVDRNRKPYHIYLSADKAHTWVPIERVTVESMRVALERELGLLQANWPTEVQKDWEQLLELLDGPTAAREGSVTKMRQALAAEQDRQLDLTRYHSQNPDMSDKDVDLLRDLAVQFCRDYDALVIKWHPTMGRGWETSPSEFMLVWGPEMELSRDEQAELWRFMVATTLYADTEYQAWRRLQSSRGILRSDIPRVQAKTARVKTAREPTCSATTLSRERETHHATS
jgi:hypothetical protein